MKMNRVQRIIQSINSVQDVAQERTQIQPKTLRHGTNPVINVVGTTSQICVEPGKKKRLQEVQLEVSDDEYFIDAIEESQKCM